MVIIIINRKLFMYGMFDLNVLHQASVPRKKNALARMNAFSRKNKTVLLQTQIFYPHRPVVPIITLIHNRYTNGNMYRR